MVKNNNGSRKEAVFKNGYVFFFGFNDNELDLLLDILEGRCLICLEGMLVWCESLICRSDDEYIYAFILLTWKILLTYFYNNINLKKKYMNFTWFYLKEKWRWKTSTKNWRNIERELKEKLI